MLRLASTIIGTPIMSLRDGSELGRVREIIVDPNSLKIIAFRVAGAGVKRGRNILEVDSVREYSSIGMIVDSGDEFASDDEVIKIQRVLELNFLIFGIRVETTKHKSLGKVMNFSVNDQDFTIEQLVVKRPLLKSFLDPELTISRKRVVEVNEKAIVVKDETEKARREEAADFQPNYVNPFRKTEPAEPAPANSQSPGELGN